MKKTMILMAAAAMSLSAMAQTEKNDTVSASYPGGLEKMSEYIKTNLRYPSAALRNGIEGVVSVKFCVLPDGKLDNFGIERLVDPDLESEALRLVKGMPVWIPAKYEGRPVKSESTVKVMFELPE